jgi:hypothetical protein
VRIRRLGDPADPGAHVVGVGEEQARLHAHDLDTRRLLGARVAGEVDPGRIGADGSAEHGDVRKPWPDTAARFRSSDDRQGDAVPELEWFLAATSGEPIKVDRIIRGAQEVMDPALSMASCIQPGRLVELGRVKAFRDSGLLVSCA